MPRGAAKGPPPRRAVPVGLINQLYNIIKSNHIKWIRTPGLGLGAKVRSWAWQHPKSQHPLSPDAGSISDAWPVERWWPHHPRYLNLRSKSGGFDATSTCFVYPFTVHTRGMHAICVALFKNPSPCLTGRQAQGHGGSGGPTEDPRPLPSLAPDGNLVRRKRTATVTPTPTTTSSDTGETCLRAEVSASRGTGETKTQPYTISEK